VGHDDKDCKKMDWMRERTLDTYKVQDEMMIGKFSPQFNQVPPPYNNVQQQYNTTQNQYKNVQPQYNPT
jgi:hypothetical protein